MVSIEKQLAWAPVWSNGFYFIYSLISIIFLFLYKRATPPTQFRQIVWILFITMCIESIISTVHHYYTSQFQDKYINTNTSKAMDILDETFAMTVGVLCLFVISCRTKHSLLNTLYRVSMIMMVIIGLAFYFVGEMDNNTYELYDIYHTLWHMCTFIAYMIAVMFVFYNKKAFSTTPSFQPYKFERWIFIVSLIVLVIISTTVTMLTGSHHH